MLSLRIDLAPVFDKGALRHVDVSATVSGIRCAAGEALLTHHETAASIPFCPLSGAVLAQDELGTLPLEERSVQTKIPHVRMHEYLPKRATQGDVCYRYRVLPRVLSRDYSSGPYFDLRAEGEGASGAGITFLVYPTGDEIIDYSLSWDLSDAPEGSEAVTSFGEGDIKGQAKAVELAFCYYAFGRMGRYHEAAFPEFTLLWLSEPNYDMKTLGHGIGTLYHAMRAFFGDPGKPYRVIARQDPFHNLGGGTALPQSFMFGYSLSANATPRSLQCLIAHEMVHNWPRLSDDQEETTWYSEGTAEFYSALLPYWERLATLSEACADFNEKATRNYYRNPFQHLSNDEAAKRYWEDRRLQRVPYGRGLVYLTRVDAFIRAHSGGRHSLDNVVVDLVQRERDGEGTAVCDFLSLVSHYAGGANPGPDYEAMKRGEFMPLLSESFDGLFSVEAYTSHYFDLCFDYSRSFRNDRREVTELVSGSNAEKAGLREGDILAEYFHHSVADSHDVGTPFTVKVLRDEAVVPISYIPQGAPVQCYRFVARDS